RENSVADRLVDSLRQVEGAYSLVALTHEGVIGVRDPLGVRPLLLGRLGDGYILTSESCALDIIGAEFLRDVAPGEMVILSDRGLISRRIAPPMPQRHCIFEYIYFARPDSVMEGRSVYAARP